MVCWYLGRDDCHRNLNMVIEQYLSLTMNQVSPATEASCHCPTILILHCLRVLSYQEKKKKLSESSTLVNCYIKGFFFFFSRSWWALGIAVVYQVYIKLFFCLATKILVRSSLVLQYFFLYFLWDQSSVYSLRIIL